VIPTNPARAPFIELVRSKTNSPVSRKWDHMWIAMADTAPVAPAIVVVTTTAPATSPGDDALGSNKAEPPLNPYPVY
jgi:hypothetical protein